MMGVATACRCMAIITGFFTSSYFIEKIGHIQLICWSLFSYVGSYFAYAALHNPWWAIPVEVIQGLIYAISWSSCITYLGEAAPPNTAATMQGTCQFYVCAINFRRCLSKFGFPKFFIYILKYVIDISGNTLDFVSFTIRKEFEKLELYILVVRMCSN